MDIDFQSLSFDYRRSADQSGNAPLHPVVVIGAGPVGLAIAIDLAQQGTPVVLLDDAVRGGEAEPRALPETLGGEEGLEHALAGRDIHADSGVDHAEHHEIAGRHARAALDVRLLVADIPRLDGQTATARHGVTRVHGEVDNDLLQLTCVGVHVPEAIFQFQAHLDVVADEAGQHALDLRDHHAEIEHQRLDDLSAAERKQLEANRRYWRRWLP